MNNVANGEPFGRLIDIPVDWLPEEGCIAAGEFGSSHVRHTLANFMVEVEDTFDEPPPPGIHASLKKYKFSTQGDQEEALEYINSKIRHMHTPLEMAMEGNDLVLREVA